MVLNLAKATTKNPLMDTVGLVGRCPAVTLSTGRFNLCCRVLGSSVNALLCRQKPNSSMGKDVSQFEAPLSLASSIALLLVLDREGFRFSAACAACWRLCWWTVDFAVRWSARHWYVTINFTRGSDIIPDAMHSDSQYVAGFRKPRPLSLVGRAKSSRSVSLGGGFPVSVGINSVLITFSRCWKWLLRFGRMRDR